MIQFSEIPIADGISALQAARGRFEPTVPGRTPLDSVMLNFPNGLVASSDGQVRRRLAEKLHQCGLAAVPVATVAQSRTALSKNKVCIAVCDDRLVDGKYEHILEAVDNTVPVIVVSNTGDWPEYLEAITKGVFDYLAYPSIPGELQRVIRNAFVVSANGHTNSKCQSFYTWRGRKEMI